MNVKIIFTVFFLVSVLAMSNLSDNLAFAGAHEDENQSGVPHVLQKLIDDLAAAVAEIIVMLDTLRIALDAEVQARENADAALELKIDNLIISYEGDKEAAAAAPVIVLREPYSNTKTVTIASGTNARQSISCDVGDEATSASLVKLVANKRFLQVFSSYPSDGNGWTFLLSNIHPTQPIDAELTINCLRAVV